jgi:hypothetical protein
MTRVRRWTIVGFASTCLLTCATVGHTAGFGLKPGLWELRIVKQIVDGHDHTAEILGASAKMQQLLANLPPDQRARMESVMKQRGIAPGAEGGLKICVTPEMAKRDRPIIDPKGHCQPATVTHTGNTTHFTYECTANGETLDGSGEARASGDLITISADVTATRAGAPPRQLHNETELHFIGASCGDVEPSPSPQSP